MSASTSVHGARDCDGTDFDCETFVCASCGRLCDGCWTRGAVDDCSEHEPRKEPDHA